MALDPTANDMYCRPLLAFIYMGITNDVKGAVEQLTAATLFEELDLFISMPRAIETATAHARHTPKAALMAQISVLPVELIKPSETELVAAVVWTFVTAGDATGAGSEAMSLICGELEYNDIY
jgi:hypothetical protein